MNQENLQTTYNILQAIEENNGPTGANKLSLELHIPIATVGRILQKLEYLGYLEKVSNKGRVLTEAGKKHKIVLYGQLHTVESTQALLKLTEEIDKQTMLDILYVRRVLETEIAGLACEKITPAQIYELNKIVVMQEKEKAANRIGEQQDFEFHLKLAQITGNKFFEQILAIILLKEDIYVKLSIIAKLAKDFPHSITHHQIIEALAVHDKKLVQDLVVQHINFYIEYISLNY